MQESKSKTVVENAVVFRKHQKQSGRVAFKQAVFCAFSGFLGGSLQNGQLWWPNKHLIFPSKYHPYCRSLHLLPPIHVSHTVFVPHYACSTHCTDTACPLWWAQDACTHRGIPQTISRPKMTIWHLWALVCGTASVGKGMDEGLAVTRVDAIKTLSG